MSFLVAGSIIIIINTWRLTVQSKNKILIVINLSKSFSVDSLKEKDFTNHTLVPLDWRFITENFLSVLVV